METNDSSSLYLAVDYSWANAGLQHSTDVQFGVYERKVYSLFSKDMYYFI
jgi:hypothetical protein